MITVQFRPLLSWPRAETPHHKRKGSPFNSSFVTTLEDLKSEIRHLKGERVVVSAELDERDIRVDGFPRADARARGPKVSIAFDSKHGPLVFMCDDCNRYTDNLRAIALTLERLRLADRYGVTRSGEQYSGWKQLPMPGAGGGAPPPANEGFATPEDALAWIGNEVDRNVSNSTDFLDAVRELQKRFHPDLGGDEVKFRKLQNARDLVEQHLGVLR